MGWNDHLADPDAWEAAAEAMRERADLDRKYRREHPVAQSPDGDARAEPTSPLYVMALDCGHRVWTAATASAGIEMCALCRKYVGVIVTRKDARPVGEAEGRAT